MRAPTSPDAYRHQDGGADTIAGPVGHAGATRKDGMILTSRSHV
ncbi:hypothetical protein ACFQWF_04225 [Methylorubrum suomiense]